MQETLSSSPARAELIDRAEAIAPVLDATAAESETARRLCPTAVDALHESGLFGLWGPREAGGFDADLVTQLEVMVTLARADMSACWTMMIGNSISSLMARGLPDAGFAEVFPGPRLSIGAGSLKPSGHAERTDGGYRATGKWGFGSGIHHSDWIVANCLTDAAPVSLVVPISEVTVHDDWHVAGLCGSGSSSYAIDGVFVPDARVISPQPERGAGPNANLPARIPVEHAAVSLGGARRALDEVARQAVTKHRLVDPATVAQQQGFRVELGRCEAEWTAIYAGVRHAAQTLWQTLSDGSPAEQQAETVKFRAVSALAAERSLEIGGRALRYAGAGAVHRDNTLQRVHRDLTVSAQHVMVSDVAYEDLGTLGVTHSGSA